MAGYNLKNIPPDIYKFVLQEQNKMKVERNTNTFSFESAIYKLLRELRRCREENKDFKP